MHQPLIPFSLLVAQTTVIGGTNFTTEPVVSLGVSEATTLASGSPAQSSSAANTESSNTSVNTGTIAGVIAGGVIGGVVIGITVAFLIFRWCLKRNQHKRCSVGSDGVPSPHYIQDTERPWYPSERTGAPPQATMLAVTDHHSTPSTLASPSLLTSGSTAPGQSSVNEHPRMAQVQRALSPTPLTREKTQYMGNSRPNHVALASSPSTHSVPPSPEDTEPGDSTPPAYA